jgi:hypothetical protein
MRRRAAGDQRHDAVLGGGGDGIGDVAPGPIQEAGRDVVFLRDGADFVTVLASHTPDDPDMLLARSGPVEGDRRIEDEVGAGMRIGHDREILSL